MRYFALLDFQHMVLALFLGVGFVILLYAGWMGYSDREPEDSEGEKEAVWDETKIMGHSHNPMSPLLIFVYAGAVLWAVAYAIFAGILGGPII